MPHKWQIFASDEFLELTEYSREEILGRNCRFLQGPDTDRAVVDQIRDAIAARRDITVQLLNYTKSGKCWTLHAGVLFLITQRFYRLFRLVVNCES